MRRYDLLRNDGAVWLDSWVEEGEISAAAMRRTLRQLVDRDAIYLMVDSPRGCTREGLAIYVALRECRKPVHVAVVGVAGSVAAVIAMAGTEVAIVQSGQFYLHNTMAAIKGHSIRGAPHLYASEMRNLAVRCERHDAVFRDIFHGRTGLPTDEIKLLCDMETTLSAPEAVQRHFADRVITDEELEGRRAARLVANANRQERVEDVA